MPAVIGRYLPIHFPRTLAWLSIILRARPSPWRSILVVPNGALAVNYDNVRLLRNLAGRALSAYLDRIILEDVSASDGLPEDRKLPLSTHQPRCPQHRR